LTFAGPHHGRPHGGQFRSPRPDESARRCACRWDTVGVNDLGWLSEYSEPALRFALRAAGAGLSELPIELTGTNDRSRPLWASGSATIAGRLLTKFAFPEPTAVRIWHEACVLDLLGRQPAVDVPELVAASRNPRSWRPGVSRTGCQARTARQRIDPGPIDAIGKASSLCSSRICTNPRFSPLLASNSTISFPAPEPGRRQRPTSRGFGHADDQSPPAHWCNPIMALHVRTTLGDVLWRRSRPAPTAPSAPAAARLLTTSTS
jgi:hypothetical protein